MITMYEDWMNSEYITIDETGWHISDDAPKDLKEKFHKFVGETGVKIELK